MKTDVAFLLVNTSQFYSDKKRFQRKEARCIEKNARIVKSTHYFRHSWMRLFSPSVKQNPNEKEKRLGPLTAVDNILG